MYEKCRAKWNYVENFIVLNVQRKLREWNWRSWNVLSFIACGVTMWIFLKGQKRRGFCLDDNWVLLRNLYIIQIVPRKKLPQASTQIKRNYGIAAEEMEFLMCGTTTPRNINPNRELKRENFSPCWCILHRRPRACPATKWPRISPPTFGWRSTGPGASWASSAPAVCKRPIADYPSKRCRVRSPWSCSHRTPASW